MHLRNLCPPNMCNSTRLVIKELTYTDLSISCKRLQFPLKISFALTINISQGQTIFIVGIELRRVDFSTPMYVAVLLPPTNTTANVVDREALR